MTADVPASWEIRPYGDAAVLVDIGDPVVAGRAAAAMAAAKVGDSQLVGWGSVVVTGGTPEALAERIRSLTIAAELREPRSLTIGFRADGEDLGDVAAKIGASVDEVVDWFVSAAYSVVCLGFVRGFPYLSGLDRRLGLPRRSTPRVMVPAGSIAIAGGQAGIYPTASPGGWHLLGTTGEVLFDHEREPPARLRPGDVVRFEVVGR